MPSQVPNPWPGRTLGHTFIERAVTLGVQAHSHARKVVLTINGEEGPWVPINPQTVYESHRIRGFMEQLDLTPEAWQRALQGRD